VQAASCWQAARGQAGPAQHALRPCSSLRPPLPTSSIYSTALPAAGSAWCRGHVCMVFERLGPSLYDILRRNGYKPFPLAMVRASLPRLLPIAATRLGLQYWWPGGRRAGQLRWLTTVPALFAPAQQHGNHHRIATIVHAITATHVHSRCLPPALTLPCPAVRAPHAARRPRPLRGSCWRAFLSCMTCSWCTQTSSQVGGVR